MGLLMELTGMSLREAKTAVLSSAAEDLREGRETFRSN
jgi:hypothetical protein